ncbi:hypothetical protein [Sphingomonas aracearum]|uniref:L,D-transpeptidase n=1 Tax=Sphingomonas aracearum TaxID=2283317 RepID=A0A369VYZ9_9SPHN|nr:hypothetical protein [Sphingomonas aracearum]RDE06282.1 hypothetical protein DVW87_00680 [Sphingomonas aracearum]
MKLILRVLAASALIVPAAASARETDAKRQKGAVPAAANPIIPSEAAARVAQWVAASGDNRALPYAIVDKTSASLFLFDAKGKALGAVPVLVGIAAGDDATAGVGSKKLAEIGPAEKTTPAGRFLAKFGVPFRSERILWVDYATSVAIHPIPADAAKKERRRQRMLSPTPDDNRITFGCINVPVAFYGKVLRPQFLRKGGYVYVLPDTKPIEEVFPRLRVEALRSAGVAQGLANKS